jgi:hypothetical protein
MREINVSTKNSFSINLQHYSSGIYYIKIVDKEFNPLQSTKFIKI